MYLREVVQKSYQGGRSSAELREERSYGSGQRTDERKEGVEKERLKGGDSEANARPSGWGVGVELGGVQEGWLRRPYTTRSWRQIR